MPFAAVTTQENKQKTESANKMGRKVSRTTLFILRFILIVLEARHFFLSKLCGYLRELARVGKISE